MTTQISELNLTMLSLVKANGELEASLVRQPLPKPGDNEVLVKILATPINPSDILLLFDGADLDQASASKRDGLPVITVPVTEAGLRAMAGRVGDALPIGNEASGIVVEAGGSAAAQALLGKTVAMHGGAMYTQYRCLPVQFCIPLPDGTDPRDGASSFVNPLTALGFIETAKREGHRAIVHIAAASNLGQMLNRICIADGIPLVNIVRSEAQAELLRKQGASHVLDSTSPVFHNALATAIAATGATIAFDAISGGTLGSDILGAMELAAVRDMKEYSRYGSDIFKQLYVYGGLDLSPIVLTRSYGFRWSVSGWLLTPFLAAAGMELMQRLRARIAAELTTTFATTYSHEISLEQALDLHTVAAYVAKRTGDKYLITP